MKYAHCRGFSQKEPAKQNVVDSEIMTFTLD